MATQPTGANPKIVYGLIGILTMLVAALGGTQYLSQDQLDNAYICSTNQNIVIADHLSSTAKTAYWIDELNATKSKVCTNGLWLNLKQYAKDNNIEINVLLQNVNGEIATIETPVTTAEQGRAYRCDQTKCVVIS